MKQIIDDVGCSGYYKMKRLAQESNGWRAASNYNKNKNTSHIKNIILLTLRCLNKLNLFIY